jgi:hypothetical protein
VVWCGVVWCGVVWCGGWARKERDAVNTGLLGCEGHAL